MTRRLLQKNKIAIAGLAAGLFVLVFGGFIFAGHSIAADDSRIVNGDFELDLKSGQKDFLV